MIDEWQLAPKLWDAIRFEVDHRGEMGQFILTGSAVPPDTKEITHSGTGRFTWLTMRPMSLYESGDSTGDVSLQEIFDGKKRLMVFLHGLLNDLRSLSAGADGHRQWICVMKSR